MLPKKNTVINRIQSRCTLIKQLLKVQRVVCKCARELEIFKISSVSYLQMLINRSVLNGHQ